MASTDEKYTYFMPGEMFFHIRHENVQSFGGPSESSEGDQKGTNSAGGNEFEQKSFDQSGEDGPALSLDQKIEKLINWSNQLASDEQLGLKISRNENRELHYHRPENVPQYTPQDRSEDKVIGQEIPPGEQRYKSPDVTLPGDFSLIPVDIKQDPPRWEDNPDQFVEPSKVAILIKLLDDKRTNFMEDEIELAAVSPNWLSSPTSEYGGGGGPGSRPVPYNGDPETAPYGFTLPSEFEKLCSSQNERGKGVEIAILDTAPCQHDLVWAYEKYHKVNPRNQRKHHPLIESLLKPGGPFHLHPASAADLFRMRAVHLKDHNYNMTDHGLFVAGIVHSIAPAADIHLYEVLNSEGVGDLTTIFNALLNIFDEHVRIFNKTGEVRPLVINCSLVLNIPLKGDTDNPNSAKLVRPDAVQPLVGHRLTDMDRSLLEMIKGDQNWAERQGQAIKDICDALYYSGTRVISAAGNDWVPAEDSGRPLTRFMASFESVQGVGALPRVQDQKSLMRTGKYEVATYSDLSDIPEMTGIVTLGGEPGEGNGVLGVYVGEFPPPEKLSFWERVRKCLVELLGGKFIGPKNTSNWAWWAGTSFATPILTGAIAARLSNLGPGVSTEYVISEMHDKGVIQNNATLYEEDLFEVTQG